MFLGDDRLLSGEGYGSGSVGDDSLTLRGCRRRFGVAVAHLVGEIASLGSVNCFLLGDRLTCIIFRDGSAVLVGDLLFVGDWNFELSEALSDGDASSVGDC